MSLTGLTTVIGERVHRGQFDEYELKETLYKKYDGEYWLTRSFIGDYSELNLVRANYVGQHADEKISAEDTKKWIARCRTAKQIPAEEKDIIDMGTYIAYESSEEVEYDDSWIKDCLEENTDDVAYIGIGSGHCIYNKSKHAWVQMSDVIEQDFVIVSGNNVSEVCDLVTEKFKRIQKYRYTYPTVYIDKITLYDDAWQELGCVEKSDLAKKYAEYADRTDDYDVLGWD